MVTALPVTHLEVEQGDTIELAVGPVEVVDPVTKAKTPIDLSLPGMKMWLTAKAARGDADDAAKIRKTAGVAGGPGGIELNTPATADKNWALATIAPADTDALAVATELYYDVQLQEPNGRKTTIRRGVLRIVPDVTNA